MAKVKDKQTGEVIEIPDAQLGEAAASGRFLIPAGTLVPVMDEVGELKPVPVEQLPQLERGKRVATSADVEEAQLQQQYGEGVGNAVRTAAEQAFNQATLGFGDQAMINVGLADAEGLQQRRERNEAANIIGGAIGFGGSILASGGTGLLARGATRGVVARVAGSTPAAILARVGRQAEARLAERLGGTTLARATAAGVVGAAEGAVVGAGQASSRLAVDGEEALGDHETVGEYYLAEIGTGAALGGALGPLLVGGGAALGAGGRKLKNLAALRKANEAAESGAEVIGETEVARAAKRMTDPGSDDAFEQALRADAEATDAPASWVTETLDNRKAARVLDEVQDRTAREIAESQSRRLEVTDELLTDHFTIAGKLREADTVFRREADDLADIAGTIDDARTLVGGTAELGQPASGLRALVDDIAERQALTPIERDLFRAVGSKTGLRGSLDEIDLLTRKMLAGEAKASRTELYSQLDDLKRAVGRAADSLGGRAAGRDSAGAQLRDAYDGLRQHLESAEHYGSMAGVQEAENAAWARWFDSRDAFRSRFETRTAAGARDATGFGQVNRFGSDSADSLVKGAGSARNVDNERVFLEHLEADDNLMRTLAGTRRVKGKAKQLVAEHEKETRRGLEAFQEARDTAEKAERFNRLAQDLGLPFVPGVAKAGIVLAERAHDLFRISAASNKFADRVAAAVGTVKKGLQGAGVRSRRVIVPLAAKSKPGESKYDYYTRKQKEVRDLAANPEAMTDRMAALSSASAPAVGTAVAATGARAVHFLNSKLPVVRNPSIMRPDLDARRRVSDREMNRWLRYLRAVEDPGSVLDDMESGRLNREGVDALRAVYPRMYEQLVEQVTEAIGELEERPPMTSMVQLSLLLGQPMHFTMEPRFVLANQQLHAQINAQQAQPTPPSRRPTTNMAQSLMTPSQSIEG